MTTARILSQYRYVPPLASAFGTIIGTNSENPTLTDTDAAGPPATGRGLLMNHGNNPAAGNNVRMALKSKTAGANQDIILRHQPNIFGTNFHGAGLVLRESSSGKLVTWGYQSIGIVTALRWTSNTSSATQIGTAYTAWSPFEWFRIKLTSDDPSQFFISRNGVDWHKLFATASQTAFFTFDQVGLYTYSDNAGVGVNGDATTSKMMTNILYYADAGIVPTI